MGEFPCRPKEPIVDGTPAMQLHPGLEEGCKELLLELAERKRAQEELGHLNQALELQLKSRNNELTAAREELRRANQRQSGELEEIALLKENLARQEKVLNNVSRELESFSYSISHDLRAPLRHVLGFSAALAEDYGDQLDGTARGFLNCVTKAARRMELQIEALLNLSRVTRQELNFVPVDLSAMAREHAAALRQTAPERGAVFTIADNLSVRADAAMLRTALGNLLHNAWKFTERKDAAVIEFGQRQEGDAAVFYVRDNGAGFDMRYADRLFGAFQRLHKEGEFDGIGVGLATAQRIIHRHGGRIWADAAVDGGATFYFTLSP